ncbi:hypothetical protein ACIBG8_24265 [Nonomuraea sp. NPDC050556]|uniref:hypothetical protein n=1 Tax=Nonomuraea sp. NPDC050556 TaxID=3364369 RepID=UPI0037A5DFEC
MTTPVHASAGDEQAEAAGKRAIWLSIAAVAMSFMLPFAGVVMALFSLVAGVKALPLLRAAAKPTGLATAGITVSAIALVLSAFVTALQLYLMNEYAAYTECMKGAGTVSAQGECFTQFRDAAKLKVPGFLLELIGAA